MKDLSKLPDPEKHKIVSFIKSGIRIVAGLTLIAGSVVGAGVLIIIAELVGIYEEMV